MTTIALRTQEQICFIKYYFIISHAKLIIMKLTLVAAFFLLIASPLVATAQENQDEEEQKPEITFLKFQRSKFVLLDADKFPVKRGLKKNDMEALLEGNSDALRHYRTYRALKPIKITTRFVGLAGVATGLLLVPDYGDTGWIIYGCGLGMLLAVQLPIAIVAGSQAGKAVDEHNMVMSKNKEKYSLYLMGNANGIGLALNF